MNPESFNWKAIFENAPIGLFITNSKYIIKYINKAGLNFLGYKPTESFTSKHLHEICEFVPLLSDVDQQQENLVQHNLNFYHKTGELLQTIVFVTPVSTGGSSTDDYIWSLADISNCKRTNDILQSRLLETESANSSKTFFLANISHGIRSHLNSIVGLNQLIQDRSDTYEMPRDIHQYLKSIEFSSEQLQSLVNSILDLAAIEKGQITMIQPVTLQPEQVMQSIIELFKERAAEKSLWFTFEIDDSVPESIKTDKRILVQILMNLIDNAVKYTNKGDAVKVLVSTDRNHLVFKVIDEGVGMEESLLKQVFNLYDQVNSKLISGEQKIGLGLAISKKLTELLKGEITAYSKPGKGSTFILRLPLLEADETDIVLNTRIQKPENFASDNRVLIIEDDQMNKEVYEAWFEELTFQIRYADDGETAIEIAKEFQPNLIITDIHLPGKDGISTIQDLRKMPDHQSTPIVVVSASAFTDKKSMAFKAGCNEYLVKPLDFKNLISMLVKYLKPSVPAIPSDSAFPPRNEIPDLVRSDLIMQFEALAKTPVYKLEKVVEDLGKIRAIYMRHGKYDLRFLDVIESKAFENDEDNFHILSLEALAYYKIDSESKS